MKENFWVKILVSFIII